MRNSLTLTLAFALSCFFSVPSAQAAPPKIEFEGFLFPGNVIVDTTRTMTMCLVNHGDPNVLDPMDNDHLVLSIPSGTAGSDLEDNSASLGCTPLAPGWACSVTTPATLVDVTLEPSGGGACARGSIRNHLFRHYWIGGQYGNWLVV